MKMGSDRAMAKEYLKQEPVVNSYQIARLNEDRSDVYINGAEDISGVLIISDETVTMRGCMTSGKKLIEDHLEEDKEYRFHAVDPQSFKAVEDFVDIKDDRPTWLMNRVYEKPKETEKEVEELKKEDSEMINEYWGLSETDSTDYIKRRIKNGPAYGIRKKDELVAWTLTHFITDEAMVLGMLHVKEGWRRRGFAKAVTEKMCKASEKRSLVPAVQIFKDNEASLSLADDLGFEIRGEHHWFSGIRN